MKITSKEFEQRLAKYRQVLKTKKIDLLLISSPGHMRYAANFIHRVEYDMEGLLLIGKKSIRLLVPNMHRDQADTCFGKIKVKVTPHRQTFFEHVSSAIKDKKVGFESMYLKFAEYDVLKKQARKMLPLGKELKDIRACKSQVEIEALREVEKITQVALQQVVSTIKMGMSEKEIARRLELAMEQLGADGVAFDTIVAFGKNSAIPHYMPGHIKVKDGGVLLIDMGAKKDGYCGDLTRTYFIGEPDKKFLQTYGLVLDAQMKALEVIKVGMKIADIDKAVREVFENAGEEKYFWHTTGHGVGLDIHEYPGLSYLSKGKLEVGMVLTIEPGLYYSEWGGIRIEDMIVVTAKGYELLSDQKHEYRIEV